MESTLSLISPSGFEPMFMNEKSRKKRKIKRKNIAQKKRISSPQAHTMIANENTGYYLFFSMMVDRPQCASPLCPCCRSHIRDDGGDDASFFLDRSSLETKTTLTKNKENNFHWRGASPTTTLGRRTTKKTKDNEQYKDNNTCTLNGLIRTKKAKDHRRFFFRSLTKEPQVPFIKNFHVFFQFEIP